MYKLIFFDLGGVVFTNGTQRFISRLAGRYPYPREKIAQIVNDQMATLYREAKITRDQFWDYVFKNLDLKETADELELEWFSNYKLVPEIKKLIQELSKKYKIFCLSDSFKERIAWLNQKYDFLDWFDGRVFSFEVGARKPNPLIFKAALKKARTKPEEVIFIDDKPKNIKAAEKLAIKSILFISPKKLKSDIRKLGLLTL